MSDELDLQIKRTGSLHHLQFLQYPVSSPWIAICIWKQKHTSKKNLHPMPLSSLSAPWDCPVSLCLSPSAFLVFVWSRSTHAHRHGGPGYFLLIWCQALNITVLTLPHTCQDLVSQACLAAQPKTWPACRNAGPTSGRGTAQCLYTQDMS